MRTIHMENRNRGAKWGKKVGPKCSKQGGQPRPPPHVRTCLKSLLPPLSAPGLAFWSRETTHGRRAQKYTTTMAFATAAATTILSQEQQRQESSDILHGPGPIWNSPLTEKEERSEEGLQQQLRGE